MKKIACALLIASFCVPALLADEAPAKKGKMTKEEQLARFDTDKDGRLSPAEKNEMKKELKKEKEKEKEAAREMKKAGGKTS